MTEAKNQLTKSAEAELIEKYFAVSVDSLPTKLAEAIGELARLASDMRSSRQPQRRGRRELNPVIRIAPLTILRPARQDDVIPALQ